jgi:hypothetical protein
LVNASDPEPTVLIPPSVVAALEHNSAYEARVVATSDAGLSTEVAASFTVDLTEPVSVALDLDWPGRAQQLAHDGLSAAVCLHPSAAHVQLRWLAVADPESAPLEFSLAQTREVAPGTPSAWQALSANSVLRLDAAATLMQDEPTAFIVRSCNPAALCSTSGWSRGVVRPAQPSGGDASVLPSANASTGYFGGPSLLIGEWSGFDAGSSASSLSYEACVGTTSFGCQSAPFEAASGDAVWRADTLALPCGVTYYMAVRATNCAGLQHTIASAGAKLCCSPPDGGVVSVIDTNEWAVTHATNASALRVRWSGFIEPCSSVREYDVSLVASVTGAVLWSQRVLPSGDLTVTLPSSMVASFEHGVEYEARVLATSLAGMSRQVAASFTADLTPPIPGGVVDGFGLDAHDVSCVATSEPLACAWDPAADDVSGLLSVEWAVGTTPLSDDVQPFMQAGTTVLHAKAAKKPDLPVGTTVYCTVRSTNRAGLASTASSDGAKLVDADSCADPYVCLPGPRVLASSALR